MPNLQSFSKKLVVLTAFVLCISFLSACSVVFQQKPSKQTESAFLLDTVVGVTYYDPSDAEAVHAAMELCKGYELVFSRTDPESELYRLNEADSMEVSDDLLTVLKNALDYCDLSSGAFDITMGGVSALYGFSTDHPAAPDDSVLAEALRHVSYHNIQINGNTVTCTDPDTVIDLGSAAKGYIADRMKDSMLKNGVEHAIIDLGGNVLCLGGKPDGSDYRVGIRDPGADASTPIVTVSVSGKSVVTSGVYERSFMQDGITYHHILDSATGRSVRNGVLSVSVLGTESAQCDILSTVCFALGTEDGLALIARLDGYEALFITEDMALHYSAGFEQYLVQ